jgi:hypothetical protein
VIQSIFVTLSASCALIIAIQAWRILILRPELSAGDSIDLPAGIGMREIGQIERDLAYLEAVTVIADKVERPTDTLSQAVEHNFSRNVKYLFLVSGSRRADEVKGYYAIFEAMAKVVLARSGQRSQRKLDDLIEIKQLPYAWDDYPLVFYRVRLPSGKTKTLAFRGDQLHEGIADHYGRVEHTLAHTLARAIVSDGPTDVKDFSTDRDTFNVPTNVLKFTKPRSVSAE